MKKKVSIIIIIMITQKRKIIRKNINYERCNYMYSVYCYYSISIIFSLSSLSNDRYLIITQKRKIIRKNVNDNINILQRIKWNIKTKIIIIINEIIIIIITQKRKIIRKNINYEKRRCIYICLLLFLYFFFSFNDRDIDNLRKNVK